LGILAAVVVFALGSVTSQSAVAACNSDAKTVSTAVSASLAQGNTPTMANLVSNGYLKSVPNSTTYKIQLGASPNYYVKFSSCRVIRVRQLRRTPTPQVVNQLLRIYQYYVVGL